MVIHIQCAMDGKTCAVRALWIGREWQKCSVLTELADEVRRTEMLCDDRAFGIVRRRDTSVFTLAGSLKQVRGAQVLFPQHARVKFCHKEENTLLRPGHKKNPPGHRQI